jgi:hypothetical protein
MGLPCNSLKYVLVGRLLNGFGSARSINRRYVADAFSKEDRTAASAVFVTAGALGMAAGPAVASALHLTVTNPMNDYWQVENAPGWFMAAAWAIYLVCMIWCFEDPPRRHRASDLKERNINGVGLVGEEQPLLASIGEKEVETVKRPPLWNNIPVMITFLIYCVLKMVLESSDQLVLWLEIRVCRSLSFGIGAAHVACQLGRCLLGTQLRRPRTHPGHVGNYARGVLDGHEVQRSVHGKPIRDRVRHALYQCHRTGRSQYESSLQGHSSRVEQRHLQCRTVGDRVGYGRTSSGRCVYYFLWITRIGAFVEFNVWIPFGHYLLHYCDCHLFL